MRKQESGRSSARSKRAHFDQTGGGPGALIAMQRSSLRSKTVALSCICPSSDRLSLVADPVPIALFAPAFVHGARRAGLVPTQVGDWMDGVAAGTPLVRRAPKP
jgi:hypothetical protein